MANDPLAPMLRPFVWGEADCCLSVCNTLVAAGFGDAAAKFRGLYDSEQGALGFTGGDVGRLAERVCREMGWPEVDPSTPKAWDVGVIRDHLAVHVHGRWCAKTEKGVLTTSRSASRAWRPIR